MAEKEDDDLDALLDSALEDFEAKPSSPTPCDESNTSTKSSKKTVIPENGKKENLDFLGLSESEIEAVAAEFEESMKSMLGDDDELLSQWKEFTEKVPGDQQENVENTEALEAHLLKTMKDMAASAKDVDPSMPLPNMEDNFFKAMSGMTMNDEMLEGGFFPMMQGMMMNLLSKDVLYPALDDLRLKYPSWLEENKNNLETDVHAKYTEQYKVICEICAEYNNEKEKDSEEMKKKRFEKLMMLMNKMQKFGQPPQELIGENHSPLNMSDLLSQSTDDQPPNKCPMM